MQPKTRFGSGSSETLHTALAAAGVRRAVVFCGARSFRRAEVQTLLGRCGVDWRIAAGFSGNPSVDDLRRACAVGDGGHDAVLAIGGGGVMDVAKCASALWDGCAPSIGELLRTPLTLAPRQRPLILLPTTAGSGAEVTPFAAIYLDGRKLSVDHPNLAPTLALVDPKLARAPPEAAAPAALDALCHAVESYWSVRSTARSRRLAARSLRLILDNAEAAVIGQEEAALVQMCLAAWLAGRAIAITRTTAAHAVSYPLAQAFGLRHGHACALSLPYFLVYNAGVTPEDVADLRGAGFVQARLAELTALIGEADPAAAARTLVRLTATLGLAPSLAAEEAAAHEALCGLDPVRLANNPRALDPHAVWSLARFLTAASRPQLAQAKAQPPTEGFRRAGARSTGEGWTVSRS